MNAYKKMFPRQYTFLPVIHVESPVQAVRNANIAFSEGADCIFLINHRMPASGLRRCYASVRERHPDKWIGLNWLDQAPVDAMTMMDITIDGIWVDNAGIYEDQRGDTEARVLARMHHNLEQEWDTSFLLFGGIAFKYQEAVKDLSRVAKQAMLHVDVITTSGAKTGSPPDIEKIRTIRKAIGENFPLANASGVTPENVGEYMPYVDCFLVATGISDSHTELNTVRVGKFKRALS